MNKAISANRRIEIEEVVASKSIKILTILGVVAWAALALVAGLAGFFSGHGAPPTHLGLFIGIPIFVLTASYAVSPRFRAMAHRIPLSYIVRAHLWRFVGIGFVIGYFRGQLPAQFALPAGIGDIIVAALVIPLAGALSRSAPVRGAFIAWNLFGLLDLIAALVLGVLYSQGAFGILRADVSTEPMTTGAVGMIPGFFVPLFILLHILALIRRNEVRDADDPEQW